jgi:hypothetical protein
MKLNYFIIEISNNSRANVLAAQSKVYNIRSLNIQTMGLRFTLGIDVCLHFLVLCSEWTGLSEKFYQVPEEFVIHN